MQRLQPDEHGAAHLGGPLSTVSETRSDVASLARLLSRAGLVEAFGHVSARLLGGGFAITSTAPLLHADPDSVLELDDEARVRAGDACPLEAPLHAAVYSARPDVGAICRTHSDHAAIWAARGAIPPLAHGLGGLGGRLAVHDGVQLVADEPSAADAARSLGDADCLLLRANGIVCTAPDLAGAAVRAWFAEERCRLASAAPDAQPLSEEELRERARWFEVETARAWSWLRARFGDDLGPPSTNTHRRNT